MQKIRQFVENNKILSAAGLVAVVLVVGLMFMKSGSSAKKHSAAKSKSASKDRSAASSLKAGGSSPNGLPTGQTAPDDNSAGADQ